MTAEKNLQGPCKQGCSTCALPCLAYGPPACSCEGAIMRRLNGGAGVAPAPLCYAHRRSGSPRVPVRPYYEGLPSQEGQHGPDEGRRKPPGSRGMKVLRFGPDEPVPGWKTPQVERREACVPRKARGTFAGCQLRSAPFGAPPSRV